MHSIIKGKYFRQTETGWLVRNSGRMSNIWQGVRQVLHLLPDATMCQVKGGQQVLFWEDRWLQDRPPLSVFANNLPNEARRLTVSEMILNGDWNFDFLQAVLPKNLVMQIRLHPFPQGSDVDVPIWRFTPSGRFTLKTAYELTQVDAAVQPQPEPCWKAIWRTPSPQRTRSFLWLAAHQCLLTNAERSRKHLVPNATCPICRGGPETILHVIRDCPYARGVWSHFLAEEPNDLFFQSNLSSWIRYYVTGRSGVIDASLFAILCWKLWKNKNIQAFEKKLATMEEMIAAVTLYVQQVRWAFEGRAQSWEVIA
ncbi:unnamed protein product [Linum trigynum]|uniref:Reverse transcriptase zinc-binding domain-containing protein n=1 Tax=Linum trigynum TaxID=586398 RepID=A0AAV2CWQ2_9ROSI